MDTIAASIAIVRERIAAAARQAGRPADAVRLVGVTKTHGPDVVAAAVAAGLHDLGENRVQEAEAKIEALAGLRSQCRWHLIGHLQSNKARRAATLFDTIQSVDSVRLAEVLSRAAGQAGRVLPVLLQVNVSGEASKEGFALAEWHTRQPVFDAFAGDVEQILGLPHVRVEGLMTIAPFGTTPEQARPTFETTRALRDRLAERFPSAAWHELSMGMSGDFEVAIEEGATIVRVGRALFGARQSG